MPSANEGKLFKMRWLTAALILLVAALQYPLWLGKGGWLKVWQYDRQLVQHKAVSQQLEQRNAGLDAEVRDLKQGYDAIEERARFELGMIKPGEVFIPVPEKLPAPTVPLDSAQNHPTPVPPSQ